MSSRAGDWKPAPIGAPKTLAFMNDMFCASERPNFAGYSYTSPLSLGASWLSTWNSAMKIGICSSTGRQPANGFALCSL